MSALDLLAGPPTFDAISPFKFAGGNAAPSRADSSAVGYAYMNSPFIVGGAASSEPAQVARSLAPIVVTGILAWAAAKLIT